MTLSSELEIYFDRLWPICRSITGNGLRESFKILQEIIPLELHEVPTGTPCFDWEIPKEWNINDAFIIAPDGRKIADFKVNNLHIVNYSVPINMELEYDALVDHLHYKEELPNAIPYYTSYYKNNWGFCLSYNDFLTLPKSGKYRVLIDSELKDGSLTYGQLLLPGKSSHEVLFSSYLCHPSMANNELSGPLVLAFLYQAIAQMPDRQYSYRFVLAPETIGVIAFLSHFAKEIDPVIRAGYVLTCCGDSGGFNYQRSKQVNSVADVVAEHVLKHSATAFNVRNFRVGGSDERQYCSPGFNWPVGSLMRTPYLMYPEYHTSRDNKDFISFKALSETVNMYARIVEALEWNQCFIGKVQHGEPHLAKYNVVPDQHEAGFDRMFKHRLLHMLSYADGSNDLITIAEKRGESIFDFIPVAEQCIKAGLIE